MSGLLEVDLAKASRRIAARIPRDNVHVVVRDCLSRGDPVVLKHVDTGRTKCLDQPRCPTAGHLVDIANKVLRGVQHRRHMHVGNDQERPRFVLSGIEERRHRYRALDERTRHATPQVLAERAGLREREFQ